MASSNISANIPLGTGSTGFVEDLVRPTGRGCGRTLARYGFVEEDPASAADGRERPWRARMLAFTIGDGPDVPAATQLLAENIRASAEEIWARFMARKSEYPADWQTAAGEVFSVAHVTPDELNELRAKVLDVIVPYVRLTVLQKWVSPGCSAG